MSLLQKWDACKATTSICNRAIAPICTSLYISVANVMSVLAEPKLAVHEVAAKSPPPDPLWSSIFTGLNYATGIAAIAAIVFGGIWLFRNHGMLEDDADEQTAAPEAVVAGDSTSSESAPVAAAESKTE